MDLAYLYLCLNNEQMILALLEMLSIYLSLYLSISLSVSSASLFASRLWPHIPVISVNEQQRAPLPHTFTYRLQIPGLFDPVSGSQ